MAEERNEQQNVQQHTLGDYWKPVVMQNYSAIRHQPINANNIELKAGLISLVQQQQFGGHSYEDPYGHISTFLRLCYTVKMNGVEHDVIKLRLFPFSLTDKAQNWFESLSKGSIDTWGDLVRIFLIKFFPPQVTSQLRVEICQFKQGVTETLYDAWDRYKDLLRRCPPHGFELWFQAQTFYYGLNYATSSMVDAAAGGSIMKKTAKEAYQLFEDLTKNNYQVPSEKAMGRRTASVLEVDRLSAIEAKLAALTNHITQQAQKGSTMGQMAVMQEQASVNEQAFELGNVQYVNNNGDYVFRPNNNLPSHYHPGLRNHENFSYGNQSNIQNAPPGFQNQAAPNSNYQGGRRQPFLEENLNAFIFELRNMMDSQDNRISNIEATCNNMGAIMKTLETQIGQLALALKEQSTRTLPSDTEKNPRECKTVTLRSRWKRLGPTRVEETEKEPETVKEPEERQKEAEKIIPGRMVFRDNPPKLTPP